MIITKWRYDPKEDEVNCIHEYYIDRPAITEKNERPLFISRDAKVAYFFEQNEQLDPVYCEIPLTGFNHDIKRITI